MEPIGYDAQGAPLYPHQVDLPVACRDSELGAFDLNTVLEAGKASAP